MDKYGFMDRLERRGYVKLGNGSYSLVWAKPGESKVIKVGVSYDSWPLYIEWAMSKGYVGNKAPQIFSFKMYENYFVAVMERLYQNKSEQERFTNKISYAVGGDNIKGVAPDWVKFFNEFTEQFKGGFDMHEKNWMHRSNGELVLTDPLYNIGSGEIKRYRSRPCHSVGSLRNDPQLVWC